MCFSLTIKSITLDTSLDVDIMSLTPVNIRMVIKKIQVRVYITFLVNRSMKSWLSIGFFKRCLRFKQKDLLSLGG